MALARGIRAPLGTCSSFESKPICNSLTVLKYDVCSNDDQSLTFGPFTLLSDLGPFLISRILRLYF